ncbi:DUF6241 domain-containing protein [Neobacillus jeddahensis]|uniref:DUF6241 domain-containing protein n=1 Tax=Neobacillus jeddahensis TaxID=1461580 RepID=UPI0005913212|nr:DUF6241 domain-containing protein [Neobacillus jeddahensis]
MKKVLVLLLIVLIILIGGTYGVYKWFDYTASKKVTLLPKQAPDEYKAESKEEQALEEEQEEQTGKIGGVQYDIKLNQDSSEEAVIDVMHMMTHQKVKAEEKWGAIPMIPSTINQVYEIVNNSQFTHKADLLAILAKWKDGQFAEVDSDHNYFWRYKDGTVGQAYGILTPVEEETFITNNFGKDYSNVAQSQE